MANEQKEDDICPKIQQVDEDTNNLSYEEKLKVFEEEANSLYAFCLKKGFSEDELVTCVSKLHGPPKTATKQALNDSLGSFVFLSLLVALGAVIYASPVAQNMIAVHYKLATIKFVLPYWNFGALYNEDCLIQNIYLPEPTVPKQTASSCSYCSNIVKLNNNTIDRVDNVRPEDILKYYIEADQPVVVTDTTKDWNVKQLTMDEMSNFFQNDKFFTSFMGSCLYETNVGFNETFYDFITAYVDGNLPEKWHANWEICDAKAAKIIRKKYYNRAYYLPDMAQGTTFNSVIAAKGNNADSIFTMSREQDAGRWVTVLSGALKVYLLPIDDCILDFGCKDAELTLNSGESVFYYPDTWNMEYSVIGDNMTIAVVASLIWDKLINH